MTTPTPTRPLPEDHGLRDFLIVCGAILAAMVAGRIFLNIAGTDTGVVVAVIAFILGSGAGAAYLTLTCPDAENRKPKTQN